MKKFLFIAIALAISYLANQQSLSDRSGPAPSVSSPTQVSTDVSPASAVKEAFEARRSDYQLEDTGIVARVLADDNSGSRHQKFILEFPSGHTVLIAHNIDLAPRIGGLKEGDTVRFFGEYEWNDRGGVVHWTHRDPQGRHVDGWLEHNGRRYQ